MARNDEWDGGGWDEGSDYYEPMWQRNVNEILFGGEYVVDMHAQGLFREAFFQNNDAAYLDLLDYMWSEYGIDFEDAFEWADFRDWYKAQ